MTLYGKFEDMSRETNQILEQVRQTIRELKQKEDDRYSVSSSRSHRSTKSRKSKQSKSSRSSLTSTTSSARLKRLDLEEEIATLQVKMYMAHEKEQLDKANRLALDEIEKRKLEIQREEQRLKEEIETTKERFKIKKQLAEKAARVEVCTRFENEDMPVIFDDGDQGNATQEHIERFLQSQEQPSVSPAGQNEKPNAYVMSNPSQANPNNGQPASFVPLLDPSAPVYDLYPAATAVPTLTQPENAILSIDAHNDIPHHPTGPTNPDLVQAQLSTIAKLLEVQNQNRLPLPEPGTFSGNPLQYPMWVKAFETLIESRAINPSERLHFLGKYVSGEAKEVVDGFMLLDGEDAYLRAKEMLAKRFGDPFTIATAFRKKLDEWKQIAPNDAIGLRKYSDFLVQCETAMKKVSSLDVLNDVQENQRMISKLPKWLSTRWARVVYKSREEKNEFPTFSELVKFLVTESNIACDPINIRIGRNNDENKQLKSSQKPGPFFSKYKPRPEADRRNFATKSEENETNEENLPKTERSINNPCQLCNEVHDLNSCQQFRRMDIKERKKFAKDKRLCYGCLGQGHLSKHCKKRKRCDTCGKSHPTSLHGDFKENNTNDNKNHPREENANSATSNCTKACFMNDGSQVRISSMIVPVWIHHSDNPEIEKLVYALLDDQSDTTFITQETLRDLNVSGPETTLSLSTMHADNEVIASNKIKGLAVCDYNHNVSIPLPTTFSCSTIPARRTQVPCPEMVNQWPHLAPLAKSLIPYQHNVEVGLLIGSNCSRAIMPREIIPGHNNEPYAQKTELGWGIVGNVSKSKRVPEEAVHFTHRIISSCSDDTNPSHPKTCANFW